MPRPKNAPCAAALCTVLVALLAAAGRPRAAEAPAPRGAAATPAPVPDPRFDVGAMDRAADPCVDFYQYACGTWIRNHPIPADQGAYTRFSELEERNNAILRDILEKASAPSMTRGNIERQIGDFYAACMDEATLESKGRKPIEADLKRIAKIRTRQDLALEVARLHRDGLAIGSAFETVPGVLFAMDSEQDFKDATRVIAAVDQGGLGLPDRDYYFKDDEASRKTRDAYQEHVRRTFALLGDPPQKAAAAAATVIKFETALAKASLDNVARRNPAKLYHPMSAAELQALAPAFAWEAYFRAIDTPRPAVLNVRIPEFFKAVDALVTGTPIPEWKEYLRWHVARAWSPALSSAFVNEDFDFRGRTLGGAKELRPRWKRCVEEVDSNLGEALGQPYVERTFGADGKQRTLAMVQALETALQRDIAGLDWMTDATRARARGKLDAITNKIGYPDRFRDYGSVAIDRRDWAGDLRRARAFEFRRRLAKIGRPVDRGEWQMSPPTVNAYYDPQNNNINFPAGILQPPFFDKALDDAVNFGAVGMVVGHELTHGFDDQGRQFDARGNLQDWWTPEDARAFEERAACLVDQYGQYTAVGDLRLNGRLTLGENVADNGGLRLAYMALADTLGETTPAPIDGLTPQQRFFLGYAQIWCANVSDEFARLITQTNPHSLYRFRVVGPVSNMPEFAAAFACQAGAPMVSPRPCRVW